MVRWRLSRHHRSRRCVRDLAVLPHLASQATRCHRDNDSRSGEPSHPLSAGSPIRRRFVDRGNSATHQRSCGSDPRSRV
jgi:hypothetical protein